MIDALVQLSAASVLTALGGNGRIYPLTKGGTSWVLLVRGWWKLEKSGFSAVWDKHPERPNKMKFFGKEIDTPRFQMSLGREYQFTGSPDAGNTREVSEVTEALHFMETVNAKLQCGTAYNSALLNWYDGAKDHYIGPHKDNEKGLVDGAPIFSISWGQTRRFQMSHDKKVLREGAVDKLVLNLEEGDLVVMGGECQVTHKHEIMKLKKDEPRNRRINITLRVCKVPPSNSVGQSRQSSQQQQHQRLVPSKTHGAGELPQMASGATTSKPEAGKRKEAGEKRKIESALEDGYSDP